MPVQIRNRTLDHWGLPKHLKNFITCKVKGDVAEQEVVGEKVMPVKSSSRNPKLSTKFPPPFTMIV